MSFEAAAQQQHQQPNNDEGVGKEVLAHTLLRIYGEIGSNMDINAFLCFCPWLEKGTSESLFFGKDAHRTMIEIRRSRLLQFLTRSELCKKQEVKEVLAISLFFQI